jgi:ABC-2 type transport system ATP-binding protein
MQAETTTTIAVHGLTKKFGAVRAVAGVDFDVRQGELFGFLGPNGAGKTTTINMLTGLARPDSGSISIAGFDVIRETKKAQRAMGIVPDESNLYDELNGFENLCFCAALYGIRKAERERRAERLLEQFGLTEAAHRPCKAYSKGMKRKLTIAAGIIHEPRILFLDEPTTGIDVASARQIRGLIAELNRQGVTIFLTTHYIEEAERLCRRIAFIVKGAIAKVDTVDGLLKEVQSENIVQFTMGSVSTDVLTEMERAFPDFRIEKGGENSAKVLSTHPFELAPFFSFFAQKGWKIFEARIRRPSLEEAFVKITGLDSDLMKKEKEGRKK